MIKASITLNGPSSMKPNDIRAAGRVALQAVGEWWIKRVLPIHFTNAAFALYGYGTRVQRYRFMKRTQKQIDGIRAIGEDKPMVWSGRSRERAKGARVEARATSSTRGYVEVVIDAPALNFKPSNSAIDLRDEVTRITQAELDELAKVFMREFDRELGTIRAQRTLLSYAA